MDPFGFGSGQTQQGVGAGPPGPSQPQGTNPILMDGYRHILEQLLGSVGQPPAQFAPRTQNTNHHHPNNPFAQQPRIGPFQQHQAFHPQNPFQPQGQYPQQSAGPFQAPGSPFFHGGLYPRPGHVLGTQPRIPQPVPQPQVPRSTTRFHYSMTTVGPDGRVHHVSNDPERQPNVAGGRQIPVPTLNDFLEMQGNTRGADRGGRGSMDEPAFDESFGYHPLGLMLQRIMEGITPHGERGDYLPYVFSSQYRRILISGHDDG